MDASDFDRFTRQLAARASRRTALGATLAGIGLGLGFGGRAAARQATPGSTPQPGEEPVFLFVQTATSGRGEVNPAAGTPTVDGTPVPGGGAPFLITLEGHSGQTVYFSDRPDRIAGAAPTQNFLDGLGFTPENPPNAALVSEFDAGQGVVVMELFQPSYDPASGTLTYGAESLATFVGDGTRAGGPGSDRGAPARRVRAGIAVHRRLRCLPELLLHELHLRAEIRVPPLRPHPGWPLQGMLATARVGLRTMQGRLVV